MDKDRSKDYVERPLDGLSDPEFWAKTLMGSAKALIDENRAYVLGRSYMNDKGNLCWIISPTLNVAEQELLERNVKSLLEVSDRVGGYAKGFAILPADSLKELLERSKAFSLNGKKYKIPGK